MNRSEHEIHRPYMLNSPRVGEVDVPFERDVEAWLVKLEIYTPFDQDRIRDLERWRHATDKERGQAFYGILSILDAMKESLHPKPPLEVRFPKPYRNRSPQRAQRSQRRARVPFFHS